MTHPDGYEGLDNVGGSPSMPLCKAVGNLRGHTGLRMKSLASSDDCGRNGPAPLETLGSRSHKRHCESGNHAGRWNRRWFLFGLRTPRRVQLQRGAELRARYGGVCFLNLLYESYSKVL